MTALNAETEAVVFTIYTGLMAAGACQNAGWLLRNDASARARDKEGMIFVRKRGKLAF
ncbi:hypothetical protein [Escherichia coli]|uniref:hypothetical protein n=1 Tax=Escherichia coli TaxID=562 RepID=UPI001C62C87D|nr:hypothetical protein [Escherichia coli]MBW7578733.1 hypothetical protein [Escherichia coli]HCC4855383.1 hypothetical protein [Escherichia coli]